MAIGLFGGAAVAQTAQDGFGATTEGSIGVLIPLTGAGRPPLAYDLASRPAHGAVLIVGATADYTPDSGFSGTDRFSYTVTDATRRVSTPASVTVTVSPTQLVAAPLPYVTIVNNRLVDARGRPFLVKGLIVRPVIAPFYLEDAALGHFDETELAAAHAWGANTIRLLTSQRALDPEDPFYSRQYVLSVANAAQQVLDDGLVLIIGVNDEVHTGEATAHCLPTVATQRAWKTLLGLPFALPRYRHAVMLEPYNEPVSPVVQPNGPQPYWWGVWQNGGTVDAFGVGVATTCAAGPRVGMNALIAQLRTAGMRNVIIADGLGWAHFLNPLYPLVDPQHRLAYAAHPFLEDWPNFTLTGDPAQDTRTLDAAFGNMRSEGPVIATAVGGGAGSWNFDPAHCFPNAPQVMPVLLDYLRQRGVGAVGWVFDLPPHALTLDWSYTPTTYRRFRCATSTSPGNGGPGALLRHWFLRR